MKCPIDGSDLVMTERQGIEIDYCPKCRGVWLDRGELDKILERSASASPQATFAPPEPPRQAQPRYPQPAYDQRPSHYDPRHHHDPRHKKRKSFLDDLFDFD